MRGRAQSVHRRRWCRCSRPARCILRHDGAVLHDVNTRPVRHGPGHHIEHIVLGARGREDVVKAELEGLALVVDNAVHLLARHGKVHHGAVWRRVLQEIVVEAHMI